MISEKSIQEVLETARIEEVVGDYVTLKRRGVNLAGLCPFHNEKTPSFYVSPSKNIFKCFGCGEGGGPVQFVMQHEHLSFPEAVRQLAQKYKIALEETERTPEALAEQQKQDSLYIVNQYALDFYQDQLFNTGRGKSVGLSYFKQRGFNEETIKKWGLGYAPGDGDLFTRNAVNKGYSKELLKELGLTSRYDKDFFRKRVMFTIRNLSGKVIAFAGRIMEKNVKAPKYINSPETEIYHKSKVLYGTFFAKGPMRKADECILVEGYTDVISLHQAGIENVVASSGTSLTVGQIQLIKRYTPNIKILYDGDPAGIRAALRGLDLVLEQDMNVRVVLLPEGEDPDSYLQSVGVKAFREYIDSHTQDFIMFKAELLMKEAGNDPIRKTEVIKDMVSSIAKVPDPLKRSLYIRECSRISEVDEQLLVIETNKLIGQAVRKQRDQRERKQLREQHDQVGVGTMPPAVVPPPEKTEVSSPDAFQEKHIARILVAGGDNIYEKEEGMTIAAFVLLNIEDVLEDFDNPLYKKIVHLCMERLGNGEPVKPSFFTNHAEKEIASFAVDALSSPYEYSENWEKKHEVFLNQKAPDDNWKKEAEEAVKRFKMRKIKRKMAEVREKIKALTTGDPDELMAYMQLHQRLKEMHDGIAGEFGTVVN